MLLIHICGWGNGGDGGGAIYPTGGLGEETCTYLSDVYVLIFIFGYRATNWRHMKWSMRKLPPWLLPHS